MGLIIPLYFCASMQRAAERQIRALERERDKAVDAMRLSASRRLQLWSPLQYISCESFSPNFDSLPLTSSAGTETANAAIEASEKATESANAAVETIAKERDAAVLASSNASRALDALAAERDDARSAARRAEEEQAAAYPVLQRSVARLQQEVRDAKGVAEVLRADLSIAHRSEMETKALLRRTGGNRGGGGGGGGMTSTRSFVPAPPQLVFQQLQMHEAQQSMRQQISRQPSPPASPPRDGAGTAGVPRVHVSRHGSISINGVGGGSARSAATTPLSSRALAAVRRGVVTASPLFTPGRADPLAAQLDAMRAFRQRYRLDDDSSSS